LLPWLAGMVFLHKKSHTHVWRLIALTGFGVAAFIIADARSSAQTGEPRVIDITARRFAFEPAEIEATVGERLQLVVRSADGVHGLEIKKLKIKKEVPRGGEPVTIDFTATTEGMFPILCSEYCGKDHNDMKGMLIVRSVASAQQ
jgi:cytochrome c oxidase subunit II